MKLADEGVIMPGLIRPGNPPDAGVCSYNRSGSGFRACLGPGREAPSLALPKPCTPLLTLSLPAFA
jgi:hypothetical protein